MHGTFLDPLLPIAALGSIEQGFASIRIKESHFFVATLVNFIQKTCGFPVSRIFGIVLKVAMKKELSFYFEFGDCCLMISINCLLD
jgi:membrane protein CcdC involved in cytochrome C biogenesis